MNAEVIELLHCCMSSLMFKKATAISTPCQVHCIFGITFKLSCSAIRAIV